MNESWNEHSGNHMNTANIAMRIGIVGIGQLGASLAARLRQIGCLYLAALTREEGKAEELRQSDLFDAVTTAPEEVIPLCDLVVLCPPPQYIVETGKNLLPHMRSGSLLTDVGSVKNAIVQALEPEALAAGVSFVGAHPMAGDERSGWQYYQADLYHDKLCFLTPTEQTPFEAVEIIRAFWQAVGCRILEVSAEEHDLACARISHNLHILAAAIVLQNLSPESRGADQAALAGIAAAGAFRDMTRIASADPGLWRGIIELNAEKTLTALDELMTELDRFKQVIANQDWEQLTRLFTQAKTLEDRWREDVSIP